MSERPLVTLNYKWVRSSFVVIAMMILAIPFKSHSAGIMNLYLSFPFLFLVNLWKIYASTHKAALELPCDSPETARNLPEALAQLALLGGFCLLIGLSTGLVLGKSIIH
jgi:hypothetical protein